VTAVPTTVFEAAGARLTYVWWALRSYLTWAEDVDLYDAMVDALPPWCGEANGDAHTIVVDGHLLCALSFDDLACAAPRTCVVGAPTDMANARRLMCQRSTCSLSPSFLLSEDICSLRGIRY
jgi:hypothetical protein